ncbi:E3 ubiquitin-protein ligase mib1 [Bulinus truncatus]|nr:E3 ubiquitin-protein ligase mib1 [Bulinus truncatus]
MDARNSQKCSRSPVARLNLEDAITDLIYLQWVKRKKVAAKFKVGDKVNIILDVETVQFLQEDNGGWNDGMVKYMKKVGTIVRTDDYGVVIAKYDDGRKLVYNQDVLNPVWLNVEKQQDTAGKVKQVTPIGSHTSGDSNKDSIAGDETIELEISDHTKTSQPQCKICLTMTPVWPLYPVVIWSAVRSVPKGWTSVRYVVPTLNNGLEHIFNNRTLFSLLYDTCLLCF